MVARRCLLLLLLLPLIGPGTPRQTAALYRPSVPASSYFTWRTTAREQPWSWVPPSVLSSRPTQTVTGSMTVPSFGKFLLADEAVATLVSPGYPNNYPGRVWTSWRFMTEKSDTELHLTCAEFNVLPGDYIGIHGPEQYHQLSGSTQTPDVTSRSYILVELVTDGSDGGRLRCSVEARPIGYIGVNHRLCGTTSKDNRIVGGEKASKNAYPWLTAVVPADENVPFCGATIISENLIVTASHCLIWRRAEDVDVLVRKHMRGIDADEVRFKVSNIIMHQGFNRFNMDNDIALLVVKGSMRSLILNVDARVRPICLPETACSASSGGSGGTFPSCLTGRQAKVAGWGLLQSFGVDTAFLDLTPQTVEHVTVPINSNKDCADDYAKRKINITSNMICAGLTEGGKDSCQGDSGGPLMIRGGDNRYTLVGIVSFGIGCAKPHFPGVYTRVSEFLCWIKEGRTTCK